MGAPQHLGGGSGAVVGQFRGGGQRRVGHLLDVGVRGRRLGRLLLAEGLFEGAAQLKELKTDRDGERRKLKKTHLGVGVGVGRWRRRAVNEGPVSQAEKF